MTTQDPGLDDEDRCMGCEGPIDRTLPDPIPEGYELMWSEQFTGRAHYCQKCFDGEQP